MVFRRRPPTPPDPVDAVDPGAVPTGYREPVADALRARRQFGELVTALQPGPLQDRLHQMGERVDAGVLAVWRTATQAGQMERVVATLDPDRVTAELKQARRSGADDTIVEALSARFQSMQRLLNSADDLRQRLPILEARLGTAVARAAELMLASPAAPHTAEIDALEGELGTLVVELDALGAATRELS